MVRGPKGTAAQNEVLHEEYGSLMNTLASKSAYEAEVKRFRSVCNIPRAKPQEHHLVSYFRFLRDEKNYAPSSMFTAMSKLNGAFAREYGM